MEEIGKYKEVVQAVEVYSLRGISVADHETLDPPRLLPKKINVITGCNGSFKTTFLEALTVSLFMTSANIPRTVLGLASTLRMDPLWYYLLARDGVDMSVNGYRVTSASLDDLKQVGPVVAIVNPVGFKLSKDGDTRILRVDLTSVLPQSVGITLRSETRKPLPNFTFISFSMPNPITPDFVNNFSPLINFSKVKELLKKVLGFDLIGVKVDELNRMNFVVAEGDRDVEIQLLGSGFASLLLLILASSNDVVIHDNIENHLHPQLMLKAIDLMRQSSSQWFITTQSIEFLNYLLTAYPEGVMIYEFLKRDKVHVRQIEGKKAKELIDELYEDLRGLC
ncbi:AAA family ATPase [Stygiolobus caldivivus]|uniref:ATPase AAA-type core domain-containing protein n=1 Tax=Stygiolobus caldivivus TaxID=2824673 RepID=A0A8D5U5N7_9CREN|nr:AAA family ATPase [Stygiolobus caldivivus]BCU70015.1 hypothetical protein KN1_13120 [Stygiolobus caldivivus]